MTERLKFKITEQLIPQLATCNNIYKSKLLVNVSYYNWQPTAVATGMSCGVDSLNTLYECTRPTTAQEYRITHLTFFENGAHHLGEWGHSEREPIIYEQQLVKVKKFCRKIGIPLISISSNLDAFLNEMFWPDSFNRTHTYRNIGFVLLLQKLIKVYYYSPAFNIDKFKCSLNADSAYYERFLLPNISTEYTIVFNSNGSKTRLEKLKYLSQFPETYDSLLVCYAAGNNCGKCVKCKRTLVEMDILGVLELYRESFDLNYYRKNRRKYFVWCLSKRKKDEVMNQIHNYIKDTNPDIPKGSYFLSDIRMVVVAIALFVKDINKLSRRIKKKEEL